MGERRRAGTGVQSRRRLADRRVVGLYDRDYMRAPSSTRSEIAATRPWAWILLGAVIALAIVALALPVLHRGVSLPTTPRLAVPLTPATHKPLFVPRTGAIEGSSVVRYGGELSLIVWPSRTPGLVRVLERWGSGPWRTVEVFQAQQRLVRVNLRIDHGGTLQLRITRPDGFTSVGTYHVVGGASNSQTAT